jgi:carboxyl-terminal processing protease
MPDYFVSIDTSHYSNYYHQLLRKRTIDQFVLEYVDIRRKELLRQYPDMENFKNNYEVSAAVIDQFIKYTDKKGVPYNEADFKLSQEQIVTLLKAYIARDLWTTSEFYEITNEVDPKFETAVTILKNWDKYEAMLLNKK